MNTRWKWLLLGLCALGFVALLSSVFDSFGLFAKPWFGYWDSVTLTTDRPFIAQIVQISPGGAAERAGIRSGDRVDLRRVGAYERLALLFQPVTIKPVRLSLQRNGRTFAAELRPSTIYQGNVAFKMPNTVLALLAYWLALGCAVVIAVRRWQTREGRYLCLAMLAISANCVGPSAFALPNGTLGALQQIVAGVAGIAVALLPVALAARFGRRTALRTAAEVFAFAVGALMLSACVAIAVGILTAWVDPLPFTVSAFWRVVAVAVYAFPVVATAMATASTPRGERARAAWLLLPLPIALLASTIATQLQAFTTTWGAYMASSGASNAFLLAGTIAVTFALLRRRVLDLEFVVSRTLVVATVSLIVVAAFVLLEWILGSFVSGASHTTGLVANGALALALGLSMNYIHKRVDGFIDALFFRKRREDERALRDFSKEAAYVTDSDALFDETIAKVQRHTDARNAAVLLDGNGAYAAIRSFGNGLAPAVSENDGAILALKTWHAPVDPHHYESALSGALALPMLARGRLLGVLLMGERAGGEAYAPDEVEALSQFSHGVGSAIDALSIRQADSFAALQESIAALGDAIRALPQSIASELRDV